MIHSPSRGPLFYDGWTQFIGRLLDYWISLIHCHDKAWKSQDIFKYNSDCIRLKEESHKHLGWLEGE